MKTNRGIDALVAEKVMGLAFCDNVFSFERTPFYSTSIADAWQVVEKLRETWAIELHGREGVWNCLVEEGDEVTAHFIATAEAGTAPLAICKAALMSVGVEVE